MKDLNTSDYEFVWTANGVHWAGRFFDSLDELRDFADDLVSANEGNPAFKFYGRRFEVMDACDMLDRDIRPERVRLARFEEGDEGVLAEEGCAQAKRALLSLIEDCAIGWEPLTERTRAAADAARALIELERA